MSRGDQPVGGRAPGGVGSAGAAAVVPSADGPGGVRINQDARVYASLLDAGQSINYQPGPDRYLWLQLVSGSLGLNGENLKAGDGAAITNEPRALISAAEDSEFLLFDLA